MGPPVFSFVVPATDVAGRVDSNLWWHKENPRMPAHLQLRPNLAYPPGFWLLPHSWVSRQYPTGATPLPTASFARRM